MCGFDSKRSADSMLFPLQYLKVVTFVTRDILYRWEILLSSSSSSRYRLHALVCPLWIYLVNPSLIALTTFPVSRGPQFKTIWDIIFFYLSNPSILLLCSLKSICNIINLHPITSSLGGMKMSLHLISENAQQLQSYFYYFLQNFSVTFRIGDQTNFFKHKYYFLLQRLSCTGLYET
jgi:hypothetical protein